MGIISQRLRVYGDLRYSVNTNDTIVQREGQKVSDDLDEVTALLKIPIQALSDDQIQAFVKSNPALGAYRFLLETWRRDQPHTGSEAQERLLAQLSSPLNPFDSRFYNLMGKHLPDAAMKIGDRVVNVTQPGGYNDILRVADRSVRESGFRKRLDAYKSQSDLYAYALLQKIKTANAVSEVHKFPNAEAESLYSYYLTPETVDAVLKAFKNHASLTIRYQKAERSYQQKLLGLNDVEPWDLEMRPPENPEPRFTISEASQAVIRATGMLKQDYQNELTALLNPVNGRLDIVPGENREAGDYSWGRLWTIVGLLHERLQRLFV
jgi:oligoendopeptidase F